MLLPVVTIYNNPKDVVGEAANITAPLDIVKSFPSSIYVNGETVAAETVTLFATNEPNTLRSKAILLEDGSVRLSKAEPCKVRLP